MTNSEKYIKAFSETFVIGENEAVKAKYQEVKNWDSVGHMSLIAVLEDYFDIMMDTDDIIDFSSFEKGKEILKKYDLEI